jgi:hypothetical protein
MFWEEAVFKLRPKSKLELVWWKVGKSVSDKETNTCKGLKETFKGNEDIACGWNTDESLHGEESWVTVMRNCRLFILFHLILFSVCEY